MTEAAPGEASRATISAMKAGSPSRSTGMFLAKAATFSSPTIPRTIGLSSGTW